MWGLIFTSWGAAQAQGLYYSYSLDGVDLDTDTTGYPGAAGCGSLGFYSSIDGSYETAWAPGQIVQTSYMVNGNTYTWNIGIQGLVYDPYGGCEGFSATWTFYIYAEYVYTYWTKATYLGNGYCQWIDLACEAGTSPTCLEESLLLAVFPGGCPAFEGAAYLAINFSGTIKAYCGTALPVNASGPGPCS